MCIVPLQLFNLGMFLTEVCGGVCNTVVAATRHPFPQTVCSIIELVNSTCVVYIWIYTGVGCPPANIQHQENSNNVIVSEKKTLH